MTQILLISIDQICTNPQNLRHLRAILLILR